MVRRRRSSSKPSSWAALGVVSSMQLAVVDSASAWSSEIEPGPIGAARRQMELARRLLSELIVAKAEYEKELLKSNRTDPMKSVTGKSSLDRAIASTRRMIDALERSVASAEAHGPAVAVS